MKPRDLKVFYPTAVLSTARDIINLWVARMVYSGMEFLKEAPFKDVIIHPTILTKDGKRMSKSLGTGLDPMDYIEKYGADATRFGLIWQAMEIQDIHWAEEHILAGKKFLNKIWNASRFVLMTARNETSAMVSMKADYNKKKLTPADKHILKQLEKITKETDENIDNYHFGRALHDIYDFFWHDFCDVYIEAAKKQMDDKKQSENTKKVLFYGLKTSLALLHPFIPHITEEIWCKIKDKGDPMLVVSSWPSAK
jgi:valyl-tRNA synthetase